MASASRHCLTQTTSIVQAVGYEYIKAKRAAPKDGREETRAEARQSARRKRRQVDTRSAAAGRLRGLFAHIASDASLADELIADRRTEVRTEEQAEVERRGEG